MGLWSHWAGIHHVWPVPHRPRVLVAVVGEPESKLVLLREKNAEWRGQFNLHHLLHASPQGGVTHAVAQKGQAPR